MARLINRHKKPSSTGRVLEASRCVHSNTRCYKNKSITRGKAISSFSSSIGDPAAVCDFEPEKKVTMLVLTPSTSLEPANKNMETVPHTLYKYVTPERIDVLKNLKIRFTQPFALNDPFEFNLSFTEIVSDQELIEKMATLDKNLLVRQAIEKLPESEQAILRMLPPELLEALIFQAQKIYSEENIKKINDEHIKPYTSKIKKEMSSGLNNNIGILSLSSNCSIPPMWAGYADNSKGFIIGFDTANQFFNRRRSQSDELYHLRKVIYEDIQPVASVSEIRSEILIQKSKSWAYEEEWRMLLPLKTANAEIQSPDGDNVFLFDFPATAISQIIFGLKTEESTISKVIEVISQFTPNSQVRLKKTIKGATGFEIVEL